MEVTDYRPGSPFSWNYKQETTKLPECIRKQKVIMNRLDFGDTQNLTGDIFLAIISGLQRWGWGWLSLCNTSYQGEEREGPWINAVLLTNTDELLLVLASLITHLSQIFSHHRTNLKLFFSYVIWDISPALNHLYCKQEHSRGCAQGDMGGQTGVKGPANPATWDWKALSCDMLAMACFPSLNCPPSLFQQF